MRAALLLGLLSAAGCSDRNAVESCRELARVRDLDGRLLVRGQELVDRMTAATLKASKSNAPAIKNSIDVMTRAARLGNNEEYLQGFEAWIAACKDFYPVLPISRQTKPK